jgi:Zn-dependent peptidase ImmA (M78 family)
MPQRQVIETPGGDLKFEFAWSDSSVEIERLGPTYGRLSVWLAGRLVWGDTSSAAVEDRGIAALWIELLEYLGNYWLYLVLEQGYPFNVSPDTPSLLADKLEERWQYVADSRLAKEEEAAYAFKTSHNLAEASPGTLRADVWFVRDGGLFTIESRSNAEAIVERLPDQDVRRVLMGVGDAIARRLAGAEDPRSKLALKRWADREAQPFDVLASAASGLTKEYLWETCGDDPFDAVFADPESSRVDDNVYIDLAYRCKGVMPPGALHTIINRLRSSPTGISNRLTSLTEGALAQLADMENILRRPFQQGHALANWVRQQVTTSGDRVDPDALLSECGISVGSHDFSTPQLDAVAFWAHGRQPAILWNTSEKHRSNDGARRATLAHEICHLLVDRQQALPLSAVVRGAMGRSLEQRANAFAAELLCPRQEAGAEYRHVRDIGAALSNLTRRFGVSNELASLQLARSGIVDDVNHQRELEQFGPPDAHYPWDRR